MKKINWKQPKYILPAIIFIPVVATVYCVASAFGGKEEEEVVRNEFNASLPDADLPDSDDKMNAMSRFDFGEDATAVQGLEDDASENDAPFDDAYTKAEQERANERARVQREAKELQMKLQASAAASSYSNNYSGYGNYGSAYSAPVSRQPGKSDEQEIDDYIAAVKKRQSALNKALGLQNFENEAKEESEEEHKNKAQREAARPNLVIKTKDENQQSFNTVSDAVESANSNLIRALIDQTTKATDGTRIRFKLLDDVQVMGLKLKKGTYLYGTVTGFSTQRVMATISSILYGSKFIKTDLAVYDIDGMEGFYVPESSFRKFVGDAGEKLAQSNIQLGSGYGGVSAEAVGLQMLQGVYQSASQAVSNQIRKNKANIKYNSVVYLINSNDAK